MANEPNKKYNTARILQRKHNVVLTQAERVIRRFGGVGPLVRILKGLGRERSRGSVYMWTYPVEKGGTGGLIPPRAWDDLFAAARMWGIVFTMEELDPRPKRVLLPRRVKEEYDRENGRLFSKDIRQLAKDEAKRAARKSNLKGNEAFDEPLAPEEEDREAEDEAQDYIELTEEDLIEE